MNKKYILTGIVAFGILCGIQVATTHATSCLFGGQGGTGICTVATSTVGENLYLSTTTTIGTTTIPVYGFQPNGSGGGGSSTVIYGANGVTVTGLSNGTQTSSLDTSYAAMWTALESF